MSTAKVGNFQTNSVTVNQLVGFFKFNLILGVIAHRNCTVKCGFAFAFDNVVTVIGFIN
jgi:hypothetical protein